MSSRYAFQWLACMYVCNSHIPPHAQNEFRYDTAHIDLPECREAIATGRLQPDNKILMETGQSICSKAAIEPVWYLPEIARRFQTTEAQLRQSIFRMTST